MYGGFKALTFIIYGGCLEAIVCGLRDDLLTAADFESNLLFFLKEKGDQKSIQPSYKEMKLDA